jgi:hypothetical protein
MSKNKPKKRNVINPKASMPHKKLIKHVSLTTKSKIATILSDFEDEIEETIFRAAEMVDDVIAPVEEAIIEEI